MIKTTIILGLPVGRLDPGPLIYAQKLFQCSKAVSRGVNDGLHKGEREQVLRIATLLRGAGQARGDKKESTKKRG